ncbi:MAG TPA: SRPBCC family protein [Chloroflexia bacterium]|nr:SRPBCC family protein [Chloroflexia bacterium]
MKTSNTVTMNAPYERIFELGSRVERWAQILPHYRFVRVLREDGNRRLVRMSAWRDFIPVTWSAVQTIHPGTAEQPGRIEFHHVRGMVKGMDVVWLFDVEGADGPVHVTIAHDLPKPAFPVKLLGPRLIDTVVGQGFIGYIAGKTLRRIKDLAERDQG